MRQCQKCVFEVRCRENLSSYVYVGHFCMPVKKVSFYMLPPFDAETREESLAVNMALGIFAGASSAALTTPTDVLKVRMQVEPAREILPFPPFPPNASTLRHSGNSHGLIRFTGANWSCEPPDGLGRVFRRRFPQRGRQRSLERSGTHRSAGCRCRRCVILPIINLCSWDDFGTDVL